MKYIDMHCDTISRLYELLPEEEKAEDGSSGRKMPGADLDARREGLLENAGHLDLLRMKKGGCLAQNFALFTNIKWMKDPYGYCMNLLDLFKSEMEKNGELIAQARTVSEILENEREGRMSAVLTIEEGAVCRGDEDILRRFSEEGVRMMTLTWNHPNDLAFPNVLDWEKGCSYPELEKGLTRKGFEFVELMEELKVIVDVSHLGDAGFWDVVRITKRPFVASHSNARRVASHTRNLTDEMIRTLAERGGVAGINFAPRFLNDSEGGKKLGDSRVDDMVRHICHMKNVGGIDCIGLGTDFDGIRANLEMDSPAVFYLLENALLRQGFTEGEVEKIFYRNALRVYREVWGS